MKLLTVLAIIGALLLVATPVLLAQGGGAGGKGQGKGEDGGGGGGSAFDEPKEGEAEPEKEPEPTPRVFTFKDYRLEMETKDGRWWTVDEIPAEEVEKGVALSLTFKLPKSEDHFDIRIFCQAWKHGSNLSFNDGTTIGTDNIAGLSDKYYSLDMKEWKEVRDPEPPKKVKWANVAKLAYRYAFTGLGPGSNFPLHKQVYLFKFKDKTYYMQVLLTTTSMKNERIRKEVDGLLKSLREKPEVRR